MKLKGPHHRLWLGAMPKGVSSVNIWVPVCMHIYIYTYISGHAAPYPAWAGCLGSPKILR